MNYQQSTQATDVTIYCTKAEQAHFGKHKNKLEETWLATWSSGHAVVSR